MVQLLETYIIHQKMLHVYYTVCYDWVWLYVVIINSYFSGAYNFALNIALHYEILIPGAFLLQIGRKIQFNSMEANVSWFLKDA